MFQYKLLYCYDKSDKYELWCSIIQELLEVGSHHVYILHT